MRVHGGCGQARGIREWRWVEKRKTETHTDYKLLTGRYDGVKNMPSESVAIVW